MTKLIVIGSINIDMLINVEKLPLQGETVLGNNLSYSNGGKGANQATAIGKFYGNCNFLASIGEDNFESTIVSNLKKANVNCEHLKFVIGAKTGLSVICVDKNGNNCIVVNSNANNLLDIDYLKANNNLIEEAEYIVLQNEISKESTIYLLKTYGDHKNIIFNASPVPKYLDETLLSKICYLIINENEAKEIAGLNSNDLYKNVSQLLRNGAKNLIITLGEKGSVFYSREKTFFVRPYLVNAIDTVCAGDAYLGAFVSNLVNYNDHYQAMDFASAAAALTCTKVGASDSIPTLEEVKQFQVDYYEKNYN